MSDTLNDELFAAPAWAAVLERAYGMNVQTSAGGVPFVELDDLAGHRILALPFSDHLPIEDINAYLAFQSEVATRYPGLPLEVRTRIPFNAVGDLQDVRAKEYVLHQYTAGGQMSSTHAWGVRKARRVGIRVEPSTTTAARERFLALYHRQRMHKFNSIPQPARFFEAVHDQFMEAGNGYYLEAYTAENQHAATLVILVQNRGLYYKFAASNPEYLSQKPNNLLLATLSDQVDEGQYDFLDFGRSGASEAYAGLRGFKERTGARPSSITYLSSGPKLDNTRFRALLGNLTNSLVEHQASREVVAAVSNNIYRFFT